MKNIVVLVAAVSAVLQVACNCDPGAQVTYVNMMDKAVWVYRDDGFVTSLPAGESDTLGTLQSVWKKHVTAKDDEGRVVWEDEITWAELEELGYRVVITANPTGTPTPQTGRAPVADSPVGTMVFAGWGVP